MRDVAAQRRICRESAGRRCDGLDRRSVGRPADSVGVVHRARRPPTKGCQLTRAAGVRTYVDAAPGQYCLDTKCRRCAPRMSVSVTNGRETRAIAYVYPNCPKATPPASLGLPSPCPPPPSGRVARATRVTRVTRVTWASDPSDPSGFFHLSLPRLAHLSKGGK